VELSRAQADLWLCEMIQVQGGTAATANVVYKMVRYWGWTGWGK
jgi:hypothetical protein